MAELTSLRLRRILRQSLPLSDGHMSDAVRTFPISGADARCDVSIECHNDEENQHAHADPLSSKVLFERVGCDFPSD